MAARADRRQEVNLYLPEFRHSEVLLNANRAVLLVGLFVGLLLLLQAGFWWRAAALEDTQRAAQLELQQLQRQVESLRRQQPRTRGTALATQVSELQRQLTRSRQISLLIKGQNLGNAAGFSMQLRGMARQAPGDLQLSGFRLSRGGGLVELQGWARQAEAVPRYLQRLRGEDSFENVQFGNLVIERDENSGLLRFSLGDPTRDGAS